MDLGLLYVETLVLGQTEDEGVLVAHVIMGVFGDLNGSKTANDLIESCADEEKKRVAVADVKRRANSRFSSV